MRLWLVFLFLASTLSAQTMGQQAGEQLDILIARLAAMEQGGDTTEIDAEIAALETRIAALESTAHADPQSVIDALTAQIIALESRVSALESAPVPGPDPAPDPDPDPDPTPGANNFAERCSAPGVVFCDPLDTEGPYDGEGNVLTNPDGSTGIPTNDWWRNWRGVQNSSAGVKPGHERPRLDTVVKASGTGSLKFDYPQLSGSGGGGNFTTNFSKDLSVTFGEGDTFYIQFRIRYSCDFIYVDCDPASPAYKTVRRAFRSVGGGTTSAKSFILAGGDPAPGVSADACTWLQIVGVHGFDHRMGGYHSCGWYAGFEEPTGSKPFGSTQWTYQPGGDYECWLVPNESSPEKHSWGYTGPNCWKLDSDKWMTIQIKLAIGEWQPDRSGPKTNRVTIWVAHEGEPQTVVIDHDFYNRGPETPEGEYGKIWLLPFMTGKDPSEVHPTAHVWYDELIVSTEFIGDPE